MNSINLPGELMPESGISIVSHNGLRKTAA